MDIIPIDDHITAIDHNLLARPGVGVTYVVRGEDIALIETGTALTAPETLAGLEQLGIAREAVSHIICTHIHMDHAGGAGHLADALPRAAVYIHSMTAPHLVDPSRLMQSSRRAVGEAAWPLHGEMLPIPEARIRPAENLRLDLGQDVILEAIATPGHSPDHLSYRDLRSGGLFIGDAAGIDMPRYDLFLPCTPPPTYSLEAQRNTIALLRQQNLTRLYITHWGAHDDVDANLNRADEMLSELVEIVDSALEQGDDDIPAINARWLPQALQDYPGALIAQSWGEMSVVGMMRYEKKLREQGQA